MREHVAELTPLVNRSGRLGRHVARNPSRERKLPKELTEAVFVAADVGVDLAVRPLEVAVGDQSRPSVARPRHVDRVQVTGADCAIEVHVDEVQAGRRAEVAEQTRLHVLLGQRLPEQRIREQVHLPDRQVVRGAPPRVDQAQLVVSERRPIDPFGESSPLSVSSGQSVLSGRIGRLPTGH